MIGVVTGSLADLEVDGVVRAIRSDLAPANAGARDLALAAGPDLESRLERTGALPLGGAVLTPGGALPAAFVIHVAVMSEDEPQTTATVRKALENGLRRASDWELASLALPPLGLGVGNLDAEDSARALVDVLLEHVRAGLPPLELTIVVASEYEADLFERIVAEGSDQEG